MGLYENFCKCFFVNVDSTMKQTAVIFVNWCHNANFMLMSNNICVCVCVCGGGGGGTILHSVTISFCKKNSIKCPKTKNITKLKNKTIILSRLSVMICDDP